MYGDIDAQEGDFTVCLASEVVWIKVEWKERGAVEKIAVAQPAPKHNERRYVREGVAKMSMVERGER